MKKMIQTIYHFRISTKINNAMTQREANVIKTAANIRKRFYAVREVIIKRRTAFDFREWENICVLLHMMERFSDGEKPKTRKDFIAEINN